MLVFLIVTREPVPVTRTLSVVTVALDAASVNKVVSVAAAVPAPVPQLTYLGSVPEPIILLVMIALPALTKTLTTKPPLKLPPEHFKWIDMPVRDNP